MTTTAQLGRRGFLTACGALAVGAVGARNALAAAPLRPDRTLAFRNLHTDERVEVAYVRRGRHDADGLATLNRVLRDWRTGDVAEMDVALFDLLWRLHRDVGSSKPFDLISGYRSPKTNAMLADQSSGVSRKSYHTRAMAVDIALPDVRLASLRRTALGLAAGGVGYYPKSGFVHVDVGPVRHW